jgi:predicted nucleic acid-binding protein
MNQVFADTAFFVALLSSRDIHHDAAHEFGRDFSGLMVTSQWVLVEVANFFAGSPQRQAGVDLIELLLKDRRTECVLVSAESFADGWSLYRNRPDKSWSLTDCTSFLIMRQRGIRSALTADHHFEQSGFETLLK